MSKYYITNGDKYVSSLNNNEIILGGSVKSAKRYKYEAANAVLKTIPNSGYCVQKYYDLSSRKNYVITNASKFVSWDDELCHMIRNAKPFKSAADADKYIKSHSKLMSELGKPIIVDENYEAVNVSGTKKLSKENLKSIYSKNSENKTQREHIPKDIRYQIFNKDSGICQMCGRPLDIDSFTIDHIVPISRGGITDISNYRCLCNRCNKWKADSLDEEILNMLSNVVPNYLLKNPQSEFSKKVSRAIVRGRIYNIN